MSNNKLFFVFLKYRILIRYYYGSSYNFLLNTKPYITFSYVSVFTLIQITINF